MHVILVTGSLGSGKTTFIKSLISSGILNSEKSCYIVNDVGKVNIDSSRVDFANTVALSAGCVCCEDIHSLSKALDSALKQNFETVIVEPSGIAASDAVVALFVLKNLTYTQILLVNLSVDPISVLLKNSAHLIVVNRDESEIANDLLSGDKSVAFWESSLTAVVSDALLSTLRSSISSQKLLGQVGTSYSDESDRLAGLSDSHVHEHLDIINLLVEENDRDKFFRIADPLILAGRIRRIKGYLGESQVVDVVGKSVSVVSGQAPKGMSGVLLLVADEGGSAPFDQFADKFDQFQIIREIFRLMERFPTHNLTDMGAVMVSSECDRAYFQALEISDTEERELALAEIIEKMVNWRLESFRLTFSSEVVASDQHRAFWRHSISAALGWFIKLHRNSLSTELEAKILSLRPFRLYFQTMLELAGHQAIDFTPPFQHTNKPWSFWELMIRSGVEHEEFDEHWAKSVIRECVPKPDFEQLGEDEEQSAHFVFS